MKKFIVNEEIKKAIQNDIKGHISLSGSTLKEVAKILNEKYGRSPNPTNISTKLSNGSIRHAEVLEIADVLGYSLEWVQKSK